MICSNDRSLKSKQWPWSTRHTAHKRKRKWSDSALRHAKKTKWQHKKRHRKFWLYSDSSQLKEGIIEIIFILEYWISYLSVWNKIQFRVFYYWKVIYVLYVFQIITKIARHTSIAQQIYSRALQNVLIQKRLARSGHTLHVIWKFPTGSRGLIIANRYKSPSIHVTTPTNTIGSRFSVLHKLYRRMWWWKQGRPTNTHFLFYILVFQLKVLVTQTQKLGYTIIKC